MFKINHKIFGGILIVILSSIIIFKLFSFQEIVSNISSIKEENINKDIEIANKNKEMKNIEIKKVEAISPEYYINSITSYGILEDIKVDIKVSESKFKDMAKLEIKFQPIQDKDKLKEFIVSLSLLGYIENIEKNTIFLNIKSLTNKEAKELIYQKNIK